MKINLVMATKDPARVQKYIGQALSISPLFDRVIVHSNCWKSNGFVPLYGTKSILLFDDVQISCPDALNKCVGQEDADWILPICDDDYCDYQKLASLIQKIRDGEFLDTDIIVNPFYSGNEKDGFQLWPRHEVTYNLLKQANCVPFTSFYKKKVWEDIEGYKNMLFNDWLFWLEASRRGYRFKLEDTAYFYFRKGHQGELTLEERERRQQPIEVTRDQLVRYVEQRYAERN